jgi:hypothetical protein
MGAYFGFDPQILSGDNILHTAEGEANVDRGVRSVYVDVGDLLGDTTVVDDNIRAGIIYDFKVGDKKFLSPLTFTPEVLIWHMVRPGALSPLSQLRVRLLDQLLRTLPDGIGGQHTQISLAFRIFRGVPPLDVNIVGQIDYKKGETYGWNRVKRKKRDGSVLL